MGKAVSGEKAKYLLCSLCTNYAEGTKKIFTDGPYGTLEEAQQKMASELKEKLDNTRECVCEEEDYDASMTDEELIEQYYLKYERDDLSLHLENSDYRWDYLIQLM